MHPRILTLVLLTCAGCNKRGAEPSAEDTRAEGKRAAPSSEGTSSAERPALPSGDLGSTGDRLLEVSSQGSWVALCRGEEGVLSLDEDDELPFHILVDHDDSGRWVITSTGKEAQLVDTWAKKTIPLPGTGHGISRDGARLAYRVEDGDDLQVVVRDLATGQERRFGDQLPQTTGHLDSSGRFLYLDTFIPSSPSGEESRSEPGSCERQRGESEGRMGRRTTTIVALDEPGTPRYTLPPRTSATRMTLEGWPLLKRDEPPGVLRWTPTGVDTIVEDSAILFPGDVRGDAIIFRATVDGVAMLMRHAEGKTRSLAPMSNAHNAPAPDSAVFGGATGVAGATQHRWVHLDTGAIVQADGTVEHAYADATRVLLLASDALTLVEPSTGSVLHRYDVRARPSLASGSWVGLRGDEETVVLDLQRTGWIGRTPAQAVALAETGHVLVATFPSGEGAKATGPFRWHMPIPAS